MTRLAWRLVRRRWGRLLFLSSTLAVGAAFLSAGDAALGALGRAVAQRARELLAADLELSSARDLPPAADAALAGLAAQGARVTRAASFSAMLAADRKDAVPRLASVKAVEPAYPLYGAVLTEPPGAFAELFTGDAALVDADAAAQHGLKVGDRVRLGELSLRVAGVVVKESGRAMARFQLGPRVFIGFGTVERTGLARFGARIRRSALVALPPAGDPERAARRAAEALERGLSDPYLSVTSYPDSEETTRQALGRITNYFTLTALATLLLGAGGMAAGLSAFLDGELETAALLRCLGASARETARLYRAVSLYVGAQAGLLGAFGGWALSSGLLAWARVWAGLDLPVSPAPDPRAFLETLAVAVACAWAVSEAKVRALSATPPLEVLREKAERLPPTPRGTALLVFGGAVAVFLYAAAKTDSLATARWFTLAIAATALAVAAGCAAALRVLAAASSTPLPFAARLGLKSLARRPARALPFLFTLAAGFGLLGALDVVRQGLERELALGTRAGMPELFFVDAQKSQIAGVLGLARRWGRGEPSSSPLVRARLTAVNGAPLKREDDARLDEEGRQRQRFLLREFNLTYADALNPSETLTAGAFWAPGETRGHASLEKDFAARTGLTMGDRLSFDVQGRPVEAVVTSLREVDWLAMRPNFFVVMPTAVLGGAPQFHIGSLSVGDRAKQEEFRRALAASYPNVSVIDAGAALAEVAEVLKVLLTALKALAWFCVAVGLLVLAGAAAVGHRERRAEAALLRALGAGTRTLAAADLTAFAAAGLSTFALAAAAALGLGLALSARLDIPFAPDPWALSGLLAAALVLPPVVGLLSCLPAYSASPLDTLRREE